MKTTWFSPVGDRGFKPRHLLSMVIIFSILIVALYYLTIRSDAYLEAKHFGQVNAEVAKRIGHVSEVSLKLWDGFHIGISGSGGDANFVFELKGKRENAVLDVRLRRFANSWRVEDAYLSTKSEKGVSVFHR